MANNNSFKLTLDTLSPQFKTGYPNTQTLYCKGGASIPVDFDVTNDPIYWRYKILISSASNDSGTWSTWQSLTLNGTLANVNVLAPSSEGQYKILFQLLDSVGNTSTVVQLYEEQGDQCVIIVDNTAPVISSIVIKDVDSNSIVYTNSKTVSITIQANDGQVDGGIWFTPNSGTLNISKTKQETWSGTYTMPPNTQDGIFNSGTIVATDAAGNWAAYDIPAITLDTTPADGLIVLGNLTGSDNHTKSTTFTLTLNAKSNDIIQYKIWGDYSSTNGGSATSEPSSYTSVTASTISSATSSNPVAITSTTEYFTSTEGLKTIYAKLVDRAGNITSLSALAVYDKTAPSASLAISNTSNITYTDSNSNTYYIVSAVSGYNTWSLTPTYSDTNLKSATIKINNGTAFNCVGSGVAMSYTCTSSDKKGLSEGKNTIVLTVTDKAGNSSTSTKYIYLDTTAPTLSNSTTITKDGWYTAKFGVSLNISDTYGINGTYVWLSSTASDTTVPSGATKITNTGTGVSVSASNVYGTAAEGDTYYVHAKSIDRVGNTTYIHSNGFKFDITDPTVTATWINSPNNNIYTSIGASVSLTFTDSTNGSGFTGGYYQFGGDINASSSSKISLSNTTSPVQIPINLSSQDGQKTVTVKVWDTAGRSKTVTLGPVYLDRSTPTAYLTLYKDDGTTLLPTYVYQSNFIAKFYYTNDYSTGMQYRIYGDFKINNVEQTQSVASWTNVPTLGNNNIITTGTLVATSGSLAWNTVYVEFKDSAGHTTTISKQFNYNTTVPEINIPSIDYNIISKVHALRYTSNHTEVSGKYCDEMHFSFTPNQRIVRYIILAYPTLSDAKAAAVDDVGHTMSDTTITDGTINAINITINGTTYEKALANKANIPNPTLTTNGYDGVGYVVVLAQSMNGRWTAAPIATIN